MSIEHYFKLWVTLLEYIIENYVRRPISGDITMASFPVCKKPHYLGNGV